MGHCVSRAWGCEVEIDMSGQSDHCLRVCNVKMKKNDGGGNAPYPFEFLFWGGHRTPPCLGWEVETDMSLQYNYALRIHNVEMKKFVLGVETGGISVHVWLTGP